jgi:hypothetical protein
MASATWIRLGVIGLFVVWTGCSGFAQQCTVDGDCDLFSYCNPAYLACFVRSGGSSVPTISSVTAGAGSDQIAIAGTAPAQSTVRIFANAQCIGTALAVGVADSAGTFALQGTAPPTGTLYATAESGTVGSICSSGFPYSVT